MTLPTPWFVVVTSPNTYATRDVDAVIPRVLTTLGGGERQVTVAEIDALHLTPAGTEPGYDRSQVDRWFAMARAELATLEDPDVRLFDGRMVAVMLPVLALAALLGWWLTR